MNPPPQISADLFTTEQWADTGKVMGTFSDTREVADANGNVAYRKPGRLIPGGVEAAREAIASEIGRWLDVDVGVFRLVPHHPDGPCGVSHAVAQSVIPFNQVLHFPMAPQSLRDAGMQALPRFGRAVVLDALLGNCDRFNAGNVLFGTPNNRWYSLDYSLSFNVHAPTGVGDPNLPFGTDPSLQQRYFPEIIESIRLNPHDFRDTVSLAGSIDDAELEQAFALLPASHCDPQVAGTMLTFVKERRSAIRAILRDWTQTVGLAGIL